MDIYDPGLMGASARGGQETPTTDADGSGSGSQNRTELDQNVEKLVDNLSSWWTGFAKKSQDSINQARQQVENQGGIVNYAKTGYAKLESSIADAQKRARDQSSVSAHATADSHDSTGITTSAASSAEPLPPTSVDKGKQRAVDEPETVDDAAQLSSAEGPAPTLAASVTSLFSKLTSDPRVVQLQKSLTTTLQTVAAPQPSFNEDGTPRSSGNAAANLQESLSRLSLTIQSHLPHLDLKESQQLAVKYMHATENFAKEMQTDMKEFVGELVRIVPPEPDTAATETAPGAGSMPAQADRSETSNTGSALVPAAASASASVAAEVPNNESTAHIGGAAATVADDEEDFAWDEEDEEAVVAAAAAKSNLKPPAATSTTKPADSTAKAQKPAEKEDPQTKKDVIQTEDDEDEDSDWE
ncbi:hypothetical protein BCV70DRAFT_197409 [Testicularia cyperi]|uniref:BSD domain-containing protein n=1 Tax=Testicularia cyperi TaxID=1882483 RepID=A0A317Y0U2_9BASI|nr:hypothetical protein BCV70DRAFT_197409 [Testicularia cyperi]